MLNVGCWLLFVVCLSMLMLVDECLCYVVCWLLFLFWVLCDLVAVCGSLFVGCRLSGDVCCLFVGVCLLLVVCCLLYCNCLQFAGKCCCVLL